CSAARTASANRHTEAPDSGTVEAGKDDRKRNMTKPSRGRKTAQAPHLLQSPRGDGSDHCRLSKLFWACGLCGQRMPPPVVFALCRARRKAEREKQKRFVRAKRS